MSKKTTLKGNYGRILKEKQQDNKKKDLVYSYDIGPNYQIELKDNMIYYKRKDQFGTYQLVKAEMTENNSYGHTELKTLASETAEKMGLKLRNSISGSAIS
tara:strand:+ start:1493 stop:1795 length:303 start_codon:yes stop_codon:yes gene_type:complete